MFVVKYIVIIQIIGQGYRPINCTLQFTMAGDRSVPYMLL